MKTFLLLLFVSVSALGQELPELTKKYMDAENRFGISYPDGWITTPFTQRQDGIKFQINDPAESGFVYVRFVNINRSIDAATLLSQAIEPTNLRNNPGAVVEQRRTLTQEELTSYQVGSGEFIMFKTPNDGFNVYTAYLILCKQYDNGETVNTMIWDVKWEAPSFADMSVIKQLPRIGMSIIPF